MKRILIIDDDVEFRAMISDYFRILNYTVAGADNGKDGIRAAKELKPCLIFLDVMMPEKEGIEVLKELRGCEETSGIPVIVITGTYFEKSICRLFKMESNCREFLPKTTDLQVLRKKVENILNDR
ncbi:MAG: hypothetical protein COT17_06790 [Elusimicrobia bacterium CG08_land_8_20_14_0_20_51_18]|nr:MAG: hypothetical protein COT17_06790 [Elusimicrobia bacterium CG08_land_8_20_14_0_20_51_18]